MRCLFAAPDDRAAWDLVDAAGICVRGFPMLQPESERIAGMELSTPRLAQSYAVTPHDVVTQPRARPTPGVRPQHPGMKRAIGYAVRRDR